MFKAGEWAWSTEHDEPCRVIDSSELWGRTTFLVWLPRRDAMVRLSEEALTEPRAEDPNVINRITYLASAARIADALERDTLVAPLEGTVIPLPHQLYALSRAVSGDRVRYLLADEVGLGKTIEAGLILRELKIRGLVKRILVVAPTGLVSQWVSEMKTHFHEDFRLVIPGDFGTWRNILGLEEKENLWRVHDQIVCPLDSVKPMDSRQGWSKDRVERYNRERFEDLVTAGWDLIVIDEAHRLGGSTDTVARYRLGEALAQAAPYLLLLSATPHQGKTDAFRRILSFLDTDAFPDEQTISRATVAPYVIRTEKRNAIDAEGNALFKPRHTQLVPVSWPSSQQDQKVLYDAVTDYVREGYNQASQEKNTALGFLMILFQRLVTSSVRAIRTALERRLEVLELPEGQLNLFGEDVGEDWANLDSQEQMETVLSSRLRGLKNERDEVELLLSAARRCEAKGPDIKAQALLDWIRKLQREESNPSLKILVFTEFVPTQEMLAEYLEGRGYKVTCLNGSLNLEERKRVQKAFAEEAQVLISTDAGGEGLNLQFCHVIFNYDLPWNPMKLEQRIGRVDRIGQTHIVRAQNFALEDTVELRVREVLEQKLQTILEEFGVDKLADVLDSEEGGVDFDHLYLSAVLSPEEAEARALELADRVREQATAAREGSKVLGSQEEHDPGEARKVANHQIPYWTEQMTVAYLRSQSASGGDVQAGELGYHLVWPDGHSEERAVFSREEAEHPETTLLSLEDPRIRTLCTRLPQVAPGQPIPTVEVQGISDKVGGIWSLWRICLRTTESVAYRMMPLFVSDEDKVLIPTANAIWDKLIGGKDAQPREGDTVIDAAEVFSKLTKQAEKSGESIFADLMKAHAAHQESERKKQERALEARRNAIERIGLPQVRQYRLKQLKLDEKNLENQLQRLARVLPELTPILVLKVQRSQEG